MARQMKDSGVEWIGEIPETWDILPAKRMFCNSGETKKADDVQLTASQQYGIISQSDYMALTGSRVVLATQDLEKWKHVEPQDFIISLRSFQGGLEMSKVSGCITWHYVVLRSCHKGINARFYKWLSSTRVYAGDVLLNITGGSIGRCCVYPADLPPANVNQHVCIIRTVNSIFTADYMHYFWISFAGKTSIQLYQTGGNREGMSADAIKNTLIPRMDISEQQEIAAYLDTKCAEIDRIIEKKEQLIEELGSYKKSLIYECVTGKREIKIHNYSQGAIC